MIANFFAKWNFPVGVSRLALVPGNERATKFHMRESMPQG